MKTAMAENIRRAVNAGVPTYDVCGWAQCPICAEMKTYCVKDDADVVHGKVGRPIMGSVRRSEYLSLWPTDADHRQAREKRQ